MKDFIEASGRDVPEEDMENLLLMKQYKLQRYLRRYPMKAEIKPIIMPVVDEEE
tara:strand:+ start:74 stop:235 length:162 start_codon:yes stop_codon:yes gene_type:complete